MRDQIGVRISQGSEQERLVAKVVGIRVQTGDSRTIVERRWGDGSESPSRTRRKAGYDDTKRDRYGEEMSRGDFDAWLGGVIGQWTG